MCLTALLLTACSVSYKFNGASIDYTQVTIDRQVWVFGRQRRKNELWFLYGQKDFEQRVKFYANLLQVTSKQLWIKKDIRECLTHHYQLFRNALSAKGPNDYVFFICPKDCEDLRISYEQFAEVYLSTYGRQHVQFLTWENLVNRARLIFEKNQTLFDDFEKMYLKWWSS